MTAATDQADTDQHDDQHGQGAQGDQGTGNGHESTTDGSTSGGDADAGADALGDKGKQALERMKAERKQARDALKPYTDLGLSPDKLRELISKSTDDAQAAEQERTRREAESAALSKANERLVRSEIKAAATGKLANPQRAAQLLQSFGVDLSSFDVDDDGEVDSAAIAAAIDDLIKNEPYLAAQGGESKRFAGTADGGARGSAGKPQLTDADVKRLAKEGKDEEIEQARLDGRLNKLLGIT